MTYTAWDYRKLAEYHEQLGNAIIAKHYLAHADALEENARLRAAIEGRQAMSYTAEQLRAKARNLRELGRQLAADDCEAHAAALEELARINSAWKAQQFHLEREEKESEHWMERAERAEAELARMTEMAGANHATWKRSEAELAAERRSSAFWKAEHLAGNDVIERLQTELAALRERADRNQEDAERLCSLLDATEVNGDRFTWKRRALLPTEALRDEIDAIFGLDAARRK